MTIWVIATVRAISKSLVCSIVCQNMYSVPAAKTIPTPPSRSINLPVKIPSPEALGLRFRIPGSPGSKANAISCNPLVTRFIQRICTAMNGSGQFIKIAIKMTINSPTAVESRKKVTFRIFENTIRPSSIAAVMVAKLSSERTISDASRATSVPPFPMATPRCAARKAGASLTPSPVTATT